jgi:anti-sigma factor RsiW
MEHDPPEDGKLRLYLLGELSAEEEGEIESAMLASAELFERCAALEADLLEEYEDGTLTPTQAERVEGWLRASDEMRGRLRLIRGLREESRAAGAPSYETVPAPAASPTGGRLLAMPEWTPKPWLPWISLAAVLLLFAGLFWVTHRTRSVPPPQNAEERPAPAPERAPAPRPAPPTPQEERQAGLSPKQEAERPKPPGERVAESVGAILATTILEIPLEVRRDEGEAARFALGRQARTRTLRFLFDLPPDSPRYRLTLEDGRSQAVVSSGELAVKTIGNDTALDLVLPAEKVPPGPYRVKAVPLAPGPDDFPVEMAFEVTGG